MATPLDVVVQTFSSASPNYELRLKGLLEGGRGVIGQSGTYSVTQIVVMTGQHVVIRAVLAKPIDIPADLISKDGVPATLRQFDDGTDADIGSELQTLAEDVVRRFKAKRDEALRRLRTIEIDWGAVGGAFLTTQEVALSGTAKGEAKLALGVFVADDAAQVEATAVAEFRLTVAVQAAVEVEINGVKTTVDIDRSYGVVCRLGLNAAATLAIDLDDFNLSLPEIKLPHLDLSTFAHATVDLTTPIDRLAGVFSHLTKDIKIEHIWKPGAPEIAFLHTGGKLLFAVMEPGLTDAEYDLAQYSSANRPKLAKLEASIKTTATDSNIDVTAIDVTLARLSDVVIAGGTLSAGGKLALGSDETVTGPLRIRWENVRIRGRFETSDATVRATVSFDRILIHPIDDPSAVLAFRGEIELTQSGTRVVELQLVEPYPFVLVARGAAALLRGVEKIIQVLGSLEPTAADLEGLRKVMDVLGRIAAAVARSAVFLAGKAAEVLKGAAELLAQAVIKVAEVLVEALKSLGRLIPDVPNTGDVPDVRIDVEVRIALEPLELRQIMLTLHGTPVDSKAKVLNALGFRFEVPVNWRPALLVDFVTEPGAYLLAIRPAPGDATKPFATVSTDLWMKRPDAPKTVAPMRDANQTGDRDSEKPLFSVAIRQTAASAAALMIAGVSRGEIVFLRQARSAVTEKVAKGNVTVAVIDGPFALEPIGTGFEVDIDFEPKRVLPLLGMGEPGKEPAAPGKPQTFFERLQSGLGQVVTIEETHFLKEIKTDASGRRTVGGTVVLGVRAAGVSTRITVAATLDVDTFEVSLQTQSVFPVLSRRIQERALGLTWVIEQTNEEALKKNDEVQMFQLAFADGESGFQLTKEARMELRFDGLSSDGEGVVFEVETFRIGRGGLDVTAKVVDRPVRLSGIDVPFRFTSGRFEIRGGKLVEAVVIGRGQLPPKLVGDANCTIMLAFELTDGEIMLKNGSKVELEKMGEPIICHGTRFTLTITHLELGFARDGGYHFFFLVTGSLRFTPKSGEFEDGLLKHLADVEITLENAPLTGDPRVLVKHIRFQKELKPKKTFSLFNLFTFELRGFGFHPASPKFEGNPAAVNISGQVRFADFGDVMQPKIDFHGLWIAPPKDGESLPRIKADGLGVDLQLAGAVKIRGAVLAVDPDTKTVEGRDFAPKGYDTYGFLGEGAVDIPGFCSIEASLGFLEVEKQDQPGDRKIAFFLYLQANKLAVEIPTPVWTFYLREAGFGFGYRYTLAGIKDAESAKSAGELVRILDDVSKRQGDLARFSSWKPDPEKDNFTLALRGAFQMYAAQKTYDEAKEKEAVNPFFFDIVAALRSDFTFLLSARGWLGVNYATFLENKDNFRERPGFRGYLYISVPRSELLLRGIADSKGHIGQDWPEVKDGPLREAVQSVDWTTTLYIRPGLFHYEMGWPDQLVVHLVKNQPNVSVVVRGGMIFRASDEGLLFGYNIGADAFMRFEGSTGGGSIGVALVAELKARFVARVLAFIAANFRDSLVYGLVSLDARLTFSVEAWMDVDLGFKSFTIRIGFSFSVQFTAAVELAISPAGVGGRVEARISVQAFGCSLGVGIGFAFNQGRLDEARARVQRFLAMSITAEEPNAPPVFGATKGDAAIDASAGAAAAVHAAPKPQETLVVDGKKPDQNRSKFGRKIKPSRFFLVLRRAGAAPGGGPATDDMAYAFLVPKEAETKELGGFYSAPSHYDVGEDGKEKDERSEIKAVHRIQTNRPLNGVRICVPERDDFVDFQNNQDIPVRWNAPIPVSAGDEKTFTLAYLFDECFLTDTAWLGTIRKANAWSEPETLRLHGEPAAPTESGDARKQERELEQKAQLADAIAHPYDERAFQARSTAMTMFLDQFVSLAATGRRTSAKVGTRLEAHVTDLGLVLYGRAEELEKLEDQFLVKIDDKGNELSGEIEVFNPHGTWFENRDPVLGADRHAVDSDGVKLDWRLSVPLSDLNLKRNPEQLLQHYEILRTIEGSEFTPSVMNVKPCATVGGRDPDTGAIRLIAPDWQFSDTLAEETGVSPTMRRALLPVFGEAEGLEAAKAWIHAFGNAADVTLTYTVTPVDTAGTRGLPRSFTIDVLRPLVPIRPATGELRVVQTIPRFDEEKPKGAEGEEKAPGGMEVYLALNDRAWDDDALSTMEIGDAEFKVERSYRVVRDPEDVEPAGYYGSNAVTSRLRGPGAFAPMVTADQEALPVPREATVRFDDEKAREEIREVEPNLEERRKLPRWARLSFVNFNGAKENVFKKKKDRDAFHASLWTRPDGKTRVATRFFLETVLRFVHPTDDERTVKFTSKRVELPVEHVIIALDRVHADSVIDAEEHELGQAIATLRPDAFETVVPLVLPPLGEGQVDAESGFARFRVPRSDARLRDLDDETKDFGLRLERDPERRVLTTVRFAAVPDWVSPDSADATKPKAIHGRSMAGYELYELDLDELAPLDTTKDATIAKDEKAWRRARRVARIEQLSRTDAQLVPSGNVDWQGWQAHYPSETARIEHARDGDLGGDSRPIRASWYSARETTAHFAERHPRLRLLPLVPETAIAELMREGKPHRISAWLVTTKGSKVAKLTNADAFPEIRKHSINVGTRKAPIDLEPLFVDAKAKLVNDDKPPDSARTFSKKATTEFFNSADVRNLLLCLGWAPFVSVSEKKLLDAWGADPSAFDGLSLVLQGEGDFLRNQPKNDVVDLPKTEVIHEKTGRVEIPLDLQSQVHPILEELLSELALRDRSQNGMAPHLYRHYTVMPQPVTPLAAKDIEAFMAGTAPEADPYGWQVLQLLGAATTIRLYDLGAEEFVSPVKLVERVDDVLSSVLARWGAAFDAETLEAITGQVFTEVFLRPGEDRVAGTFDSVIEGSLEVEKAEKIEPDEEGLAFLQVSLRPRPVAVWTYMRQALGWTDPVDKLLSKPGQRLVGMSIRLTSKGRAMEAARARGGATFELTNVAGSFVSIPIPLGRRSKMDADREIELYFRVEAGLTAPADRPDIALALEFEVVEIVNDADGKPMAVNHTDVEVFPLGSDLCPLTAPKPWSQVKGPAVVHPDPFDRFSAISVEKWTTAYEGSQQPAVDSLAAFRQAAHGGGLELPADDGPSTKHLTETKKVIPTYLDWSQRFLDHGVARQPDNARPTEPFVAICAPIKASPWRLAADARGSISLAFLHSDRWGHARAYAVKPVSRYHELLAGIGVQVQREAAAFVPEKGFARDIGFAVAVSPRTERIEAPVIMSSRVHDTTGVAEVVVARHGEEALSMSNRPLLAHLGVPASLIAFGRAYRTPDWPTRMNAFFDPTQQKPSADTLPAREVALHANPAPQVLAQVNATDVGALAARLPSLWKGADIWRIPPLPPHYKLITLTSERAGIVVSDVTGVVLDDFPRRELDGRADELLPAGKVTLSLTRLDGKVRLVVCHPLLSHAQLSPKDLLPEITPDDDVARWPDPDVLYVLLRRLEKNGETTEQEDAEIRLVATGPNDATAQPVVIRARGTDYAAPPAPPRPVVGFESQTAKVFVLRSPLDRNDAGIQAARLDAEEFATGSIEDFNASAADLYAAILTPHETTIDLPVVDGEGGPAYLARLQTFLTQLGAGITQHLGSRPERWYDKALTSQARGRAAALANWIVTDGTTLASTANELEVREQAPLPIVLSAPWRPGLALPDLVAGEASVTRWKEKNDIAKGTYLAVFDLAADDDLATKLPQTVPPVAKRGKRLYSMLAARVLGPNSAFFLKAVDARSRMTIDASTAKTTAVIERQITELPVCFRREA